MSLNSVGAITGIVLLVAILVLYGHEKAKIVSHPRVNHQVVAPAPTPPPPLPAPKPNIVSRIFKPTPKPVAKPAVAKPAAKATPTAQGKNTTDFCTQVKAVVAEHGKAWALARAKELGYTAPQIAAVEKCMN